MLGPVCSPPSYISVGELPSLLFLHEQFQNGGSGEALEILILRHKRSQRRGENVQRLHDCWRILRTVIISKFLYKRYAFEVS